MCVVLYLLSGSLRNVQVFLRVPSLVCLFFCGKKRCFVVGSQAVYLVWGLGELSEGGPGLRLSLASEGGPGLRLSLACELRR